LRGVNLNALGDYYQGNPNYPPVIPLTDDDFPNMARQGFNVVRLILSWSSLEPTRDQVSADYLNRIHAAVDAAKANGIYTVLDMHQDAWGKYIASPPGIHCPPVAAPAIGWDGAPEWATLTDGRSTCVFGGTRELAPAVGEAFANFYKDRDGIQSHFIQAWAALAAEFAAEPAVAGYDLLNEPHWGNDLGAATANLAVFSGRLIDAIRTAEQQAHGFSHVAFFEPIILWPVPQTAPPAGFTTDDNIVFAPHNYAESISSTVTIEQGFARAAEDAATYGVTFWIGEYGWFNDPEGNKPRVVRYAQAEDQYFVGGTWWQWHQACGDPHTIGKQGGEPPNEVIQFNRTFCPGDVNGGPVPEWAVVLSRPYPRAAPGHLVTLQSDGASATLQLTGVTDAGVTDAAGPGGTLDLWVPDRSQGKPLLTGTGLGAVQTVTVPGGYRLLADVSGNYTVALDWR
jgi:endoglycosylceramidase